MGATKGGGTGERFRKPDELGPADRFIWRSLYGEQGMRRKSFFLRSRVSVSNLFKKEKKKGDGGWKQNI